MLKKLFFVYTIIITVMVVWLICSLTLNNTGVAIFTTEIPISFFTNNILSIITMSICAIKLQRKNENYVVRVLPFLLLVGTLATLISYDLIQIKGFSVEGTIIETIAKTISDFMNSSYTYIIPLAVLTLLEPNNKITEILKKIGWVTVGITAAINIFVMIKTEMVATLPNLYSNTRLGLTSLAETKEVPYTILLVTVIIEVAVVIIGFMTNYCLESETIRSEDLDYQELMDQANAIAKARQEQAYGKPKAVPDAILNTTQEEGALNLSNQMSAKSNVGVVDKNSKLKVQNIDKNLMKVGAVVNSKVEEQIENTRQLQKEQIAKAAAEQAQAQSQQQTQQAQQPQQQVQTQTQPTTNTEQQVAQQPVEQNTNNTQQQ